MCEGVVCVHICLCVSLDLSVSVSLCVSFFSSPASPSSPASLSLCGSLPVSLCLFWSCPTLSFSLVSVYQCLSWLPVCPSCSVSFGVSPALPVPSPVSWKSSTSCIPSCPPSTPSQSVSSCVWLCLCVSPASRGPSPLCPLLDTPASSLCTLSAAPRVTKPQRRCHGGHWAQMPSSRAKSGCPSWARVHPWPTQSG